MLSAQVRVLTAALCGQLLLEEVMYLLTLGITGVILLVLALSSPASAHCSVGDRFFPATLIVDDPCVNDELSIPTIAGFKNGNQPSADELDISSEYSKTITERFGVSAGDTWVHLHEPGDGNHAGFDNLETSFKYQFIKSERHFPQSIGRPLFAAASR